MFCSRRQTIGRQGVKSLSQRVVRTLRAALAFLLAYGLVAQLIVLTFAVTTLTLPGGAASAAMRSASGAFAVTDGSRTATGLAMVLCRPGATLPDAIDDGQTAPESIHGRLCCGICALQGAGLAPPAEVYTLLAREWRTVRAGFAIPEGPHLVTPRLSPPARGPPLGCSLVDQCA